MSSNPEVSPEQQEYAGNHLFVWPGVQALASHIDEVTAEPVINGMKKTLYGLLSEAGLEADELELYSSIVVGIAHAQNMKLRNRRDFIDKSGLLVIHRVGCSCINCRDEYSVATDKLTDEHRVRIASDPNVERDFSDYGRY